MNKDKFYITTTLPYVNADPHIGSTLEFIQADVIARFFRDKLGDENVFFNIGADEHGLKMYTKAKEAGKSPQEYVDYYADRWQEFADLFLISYNHFYRTSSKEHHKAAQEFWRRSLENGDIYKKEYSGLYCVGHEAFLTEKELVDGKCPDHGTEPVNFSEENYFFRLSKYSEPLLNHFKQNPDTVKPAHKLNELINWIEGMEDISISRIKENLPWGIDVPDDPEQVFYVWFDALTNYVAVVGFPDDEEKLNSFWPGIQLFGPDNLRFQGAIWQAMLASVGLPYTQKLLCHGMVLAEDGTKMSKSKGNVVSPFDQEGKYPVEAIRYYIVAGLTTYGDPAYKEEDLVSMYNADLADNYGNLLNRIIHLANKYEFKINDPDSAEASFVESLDQMVAEVRNLFEGYELQQAAAKITEINTFGNKYIDENKPWKQENSDSAERVLNNLSILLDRVNSLYKYIIPETAVRADKHLKSQETVILFEKLEHV